jgi:hypothetical protein
MNQGYILTCCFNIILQVWPFKLLSCIQYFLLKFSLLLPSLCSHFTFLAYFILYFTILIKLVEESKWWSFSFSEPLQSPVSLSLSGLRLLCQTCFQKTLKYMYAVIYEIFKAGECSDCDTEYIWAPNFRRSVLSSSAIRRPCSLRQQVFPQRLIHQQCY